MKFTTYEQFKNTSDEELSDIDPEDYTDSEFIQLRKWLKQLEQELEFDENDGCLMNLDEESIKFLCLDNEFFYDSILTENLERYFFKGNMIIGRKVFDGPDYVIVRENGKNNFYRIMK